jgi:hypothetical protein
MTRATIIVGTLFATLLPVPAAAQVTVGLTAGVNRSDYHADVGNAVHSSRMGVVLGGVLDLPVAGAVSLRVEPLYIRKGGSAEDAALREEITIGASVLEVPLFARLELGEGGRPYLLGGPTLGFLLNSDLTGSDTGIPFEANLMDVSRRFDFGVGLGAGWTQGFGRVGAFLEGRYVWGLTNLMKGGDLVLSSPGTPVTATVTFDEEDDRYEYRGLQFLLGFSVPVGGGS